MTVWFAGAYPADRHAEKVETRLRAAASAFTFMDLAPPPGPALAKLERRAGFRVWFSAPGGTIELKADSPHWTFWQPRCVIARVYPDNSVRTHVLRATNCFKAKWPSQSAP